MKNFKNTIIVSLVTTVAFAASFGIASASITPKVYVAPVGMTKAAGQTFGAGIAVTTNTSDIVYAVEGTIGFDNLTCKGISASQGLMIQSMPTCANPHFVVGIPNGMNSTKSLFSVSVAGSSEGQAAVTLSGVDVIGNGVSLSNEGSNGVYTIHGVVAAPTQEVTTSPIVEINANGEVITQDEATTTEASTTVELEIPEATTSTTTVATATSTGLLAAVGEALYGIPSALVIVVGAVLLALFAGLLYYRRTKPEEQI